MEVFEHRQRQTGYTGYVVPLVKLLPCDPSIRNASELHGYSRFGLCLILDRQFDTMGVLSRDLAKFHHFGRLSFNKSISDDDKVSDSLWQYDALLLRVPL
jgi:hypothetical protein